MPYRDPEQQRTYKREWMRIRRAGESGTRGTLVSGEDRITTASDVLAIVAEQLDAVRGDEKASTLEKARAVGYLAGVALKAVEAANLAGRVESLERTLGERQNEKRKAS